MRSRPSSSKYALSVGAVLLHALLQLVEQVVGGRGGLGVDVEAHAGLGGEAHAGVDGVELVLEQIRDGALDGPGLDLGTIDAVLDLVLHERVEVLLA